MAGTEYVSRARSTEISTLAMTELIGKLTGDAKDMIVELIRTASTNPLSGVMLGLIVPNILMRTGIIDQPTEQLVQITVLGITGITISQEVINSLSNLEAILPFSTKVPSTISDITPSLQVAVNGNTDTSSLTAAISKLITKPG